MNSFFDRFLSLTKTIFESREGMMHGKVDMQKTYYFTKEFGVSVPFNFRWGKLGPFSYELSNVFDTITRQGYVDYDGAYHYDERNFTYVEESEFPSSIPRFFYELEDICEQEGYNRVHFIECLASLHFLYKYSGMNNQSLAFRRLSIVKENRMALLEHLMVPAWNLLIRYGLVAG